MRSVDWPSRVSGRKLGLLIPNASVWGFERSGQALEFPYYSTDLESIYTAMSLSAARTHPVETMYRVCSPCSPAMSIGKTGT